MKKLLFIPILLFVLTGCSQSLGGRTAIELFSKVGGIIRPASVADDFMLGSLVATTTSTLYCDVSKKICYIPNANIGSLTLSSILLTPVKIRYSAGSATTTQMDVAKSGNFNISTATSTFPNQLVLKPAGGVYSNGYLINGTSTTCFTYTPSSTFATIDLKERITPGFAMTIVKVKCNVENGTSLDLGITDGTNVMSSTTCATAETITYPSVNNTFAKDKNLILDIGTNRGSVDAFYKYCFDYFKN